MRHHTTQIAGLVEPGAVSEDPSVLEEYASDRSLAPRRMPRAVVRPGSAEEVHRIVVWANESCVPLVPVSSGAPHHHGDTVPSVGGAVIVDLRGMDRILRIDRRNRITVIEPGVTYPQLQAALAEHGMRVTPPLRPRPGKSVVASLLEREPTLIPRYNSALPEPLRDCGVVWGSGETMFTGEAGGGPQSLETQWQSGLVQAEAKGPAQTDFYRLLTGAQGTMGIVTWASVKCQLSAEAHQLGFVTAERLDDLVPLVRRLCLLRLGDEIMVFDRVRLSRLLGVDGLPAWTLVVGLGGRRHFAEERVRVQAEDARACAAEAGLTFVDELPGVPAQVARDALLGPASATDGACNEACVLFLTTLDRVSGHVAIMRAAAAAEGFRPGDVGVYVQPQHQGVSHHVEFSVPFDAGSADQRRRAARLVAAAGAGLISAGAYFSRPYGPWAQPVYNRDAASRDALRRVKAIFDPAGIMNPGKLCFGAPQTPAAARAAAALVGKEA